LVQKHKLLYEVQFGFRLKRSTIDALTKLISDVLLSLDKKEDYLAVYLDLSKAFDTLNHDILLLKLSHCKIRGKYLEWLQSYLWQQNSTSVTMDITQT